MIMTSETIANAADVGLGYVQTDVRTVLNVFEVWWRWKEQERVV
jgi:hypothetical protein